MSIYNQSPKKIRTLFKSDSKKKIGSSFEKRISSSNFSSINTMSVTPNKILGLAKIPRVELNARNIIGVYSQKIENQTPYTSSEFKSFLRKELKSIKGSKTKKRTQN